MTLTAEQLAQLREVAANLKDVARHSVDGYGRQDIHYNDPEGEFVFYSDYATLLDELERKDKRIAELERHEYFRIRQNVIDGLASSGESWDDIQEYMQKWDAESAGDGINLTVEG